MQFLLDKFFHVQIFLPALFLNGIENEKIEFQIKLKVTRITLYSNNTLLKKIHFTTLNKTKRTTISHMINKSFYFQQQKQNLIYQILSDYQLLALPLNTQNVPISNNMYFFSCAPQLHSCLYL